MEIIPKILSTPPELPDVMKPGADTAAQVGESFVDAEFFLSIVDTGQFARTSLDCADF